MDHNAHVLAWELQNAYANAYDDQDFLDSLWFG